MRLIGWNGAVEHTSKINQVDMYLQFVICMQNKMMSSFSSRVIMLLYQQSEATIKAKAYAPHCNLFGIVDKKIRLVVEICNKESEEDVNGKETVDNVVDDKKSILLVSQESKLEWANPGRVNDENNE